MIRLPEDEEFLEELEQLRDWFSDKLCESAPQHPDDIAKLHKRMMSVGWICKSEVERYEDLQKDDDD